MEICKLATDFIIARQFQHFISVAMIPCVSNRSTVVIHRLLFFWILIMTSLVKAENKTLPVLPVSFRPTLSTRLPSIDGYQRHNRDRPPHKPSQPSPFHYPKVVPTRAPVDSHIPGIENSSTISSGETHAPNAARRRPTTTESAPEPENLRAPLSFPTLPPMPVSTLQPTKLPTLPPSASPTSQPTQAPTLPPSAAPTLQPTPFPTHQPTQRPTQPPTSSPTVCTAPFSCSLITVCLLKSRV